MISLGWNLKEVNSWRLAAECWFQQATPERVRRRDGKRLLTQF